MRGAALPVVLVLLSAACGGRPADHVPVRKEPASSDARERMVRDQIEARGIEDPHVLAAMRAVPRDAFVPEPWTRHAYEDTALPIGHEQTISQPFIVASMTAVAGIRPGDRVLEIGTGSGYQAAVLAEITPHVWTIEIIDELAASAADRLARLGYTSVVCRAGDGYAGWPEEAPFDAILVTAAPDAPPPALVDQLRPGGRMILPLDRGAAAQAMTRITKEADGSLRTETLYPVTFVPFTRAEDHE